MESGFDHDFSQVKIHHNSQSDRLSRSLDAQAFTVGQDVYFRQGSYNPHSQPGKKLLAHELSHVVQQSGENSPSVLQRKPINWKDKKKALIVEEDVSGSKKKAKLYIKAKIIDQSALLKKAKTKLKKIIKKSKGKYKSVRTQLPKVKKEFSLASISSKLLDADGNKYKITATIKPPSKAQRKATGAGNINEVNPAITNTIQRAQGKGTTLAKSAREPMEKAFGYDFSPVRIHHNSQSDRLSRSLNAKAFTVGGDIFFRQGAYKPETSGGKKLLAHELTHVVQQSGAQPHIMPDRGSSSQSNGDHIHYFNHNNDSLVNLSPTDSNLIQRVAGAVGASLAAEALRSGAFGFGSGTDVDVKSKIQGNSLELIVKRESDSSNKMSNLLGDENESDVESESLPDELVNDIVKVIIAIVNQSPQPDVVDSKLDDVRRNFDLRLVDLVSSAEIGNNYEYVIKVKGQSKAVKPKGIKDFLNNLKNQAKDAVKNAIVKDDQDSNQPEKAVVEKPKPIESRPIANNQNKDNNLKDNKQPLIEEPKPEVAEAKRPKPEKNKDKDRQDKQSGGIQVDVNTKVVRIDDSTVDITVRANH